MNFSSQQLTAHGAAQVCCMFQSRLQLAKGLLLLQWTNVAMMASSAVVTSITTSAVQQNTQQAAASLAAVFAPVLQQCTVFPLDRQHC